MNPGQEICYFLKSHDKMVGIDVGWSSVKFLLVKKSKKRFSFQYEILKENLFDINYERKEELVEKIREVAQILGIKSNTPVYLSFSHDIQTVEEPKKVKKGKFGNEYIVLPFNIRSQLTSSQNHPLYFMANKSKIYEILDFFEGCKIHVDSFTFSSLAICGGLGASLSGDEYFDIMATLDVGAQQTLCSISAGHFVLSVQKFDFGADRWCELINVAMGKEMFDTKQLDPKILNKIPEEIKRQVIEESMEEIRQYFLKLETDKALTPKKILLSGGAARFPDVTAFLEDSLGIPTQVWGIRGEIQLKNNSGNLKRFLYDEPVLAVSMGLLSRVVPMKQVSFFTSFFKKLERLSGKILGHAS